MTCRLLLLITLIGYTHALYGGKEINIEEAPYQVSIWERLHLACGGSILSDEWVLTLSSCLDPFVENFVVRAGSSQKGNGSVHVIAEVHNHILGIGGKVDAGREIALLRISPPLILDSTRQPIKLINADYKLQPDTPIKVSGYGYTDGFVESTGLRSAEAKTMLLEDCVKMYGWRFGSLYPGLLCTDGRKYGSSGCIGDTGNPVILEDGRQVAVATSRYGCGKEDEPDVHILVARARDWIKLISGV